MAHWAKQLRRFGGDSLQLAKAVMRQRGDNVKPILLEHAKKSNAAANSLLMVDKEIGMVKYYGLSGYLKNRMQSTTAAAGDSSRDSSNASSLLDSNSNSNNTNGGGAKIAFMVTASMKQELQERLGYEPESIKSMTPLQASLILNYSIKPAQMDIELPKAELEYEEQRKAQETANEEMRLLKEQEAVVLAEKQKQQQQEAESVLPADSVPDPVAATAGGQKVAGQYTNTMGITEHFESSGGYASVNLLEHPEKSGWAGIWFEVLETKNGETSRVGLYQDEEEANLGKSTREEIAEKKNEIKSFAINPVPIEQL